MIAKKVFFTKGMGKDVNKLTSFEMALRMAKIQSFNLVHVSSILAPKAKIVPREQGLKLMHHGQIAFTVKSHISTNEPNRLIAASVGMARPVNHEKMYGYLSEHESYGETAKKAGDYAEDLAAEMLATTLGIAFDLDDSWDSKRRIFKMSKLIVNTRNITQTARGDCHGRWTTVIAACVFII